MKLDLMNSKITGLNLSQDNQVLSLYLSDCPEKEPTSYNFPKVKIILIKGITPSSESIILSHSKVRSGEDWKHTILSQHWEIIFESPTVTRSSLCW